MPVAVFENGVILTSSIASPSSLPVTSLSAQRNQTVPELGILMLSIFPETIVWFADKFPFNAPTLPVVTGAVKSNAVTAVQVAKLSVIDVAFVLY